MSYCSFTIPRPIYHLTLSIIILMVCPGQGSAHDPELLSIRLDPRPFSPALCQRTGHDKAIRIQAAKYRDLIVRQVPGQNRPSETGKARIKDYVHFLTLQDLTDGVVNQGAIAFDRNYAVIFTIEYPNGLARQNLSARSLSLSND